MAKKASGKKSKKAEESESSDANAERLEQELKDLIEINESRSGAFSKIITAIENHIDKPNKK